MNYYLSSQLETMVETAREFCNGQKLLCVAIISSLYLVIAGLISSWRMLWNDELFTLYIARLESLSDILEALSTGADQNPPSFYFITRVFLTLLGESPLTVRLPEILGVLLLSICLFLFVSHRLPVLYGIAAMLFPLTTTAFEYAYEARPYGLVLGFSGSALLCWQRAADHSRSVWWLIGLTASGAAAISCHYYAVLLLVPLGAGELARTWSNRRIDYPAWICLGLTLFPLLVFFPLLQEARSYSQHFWAHPEWKNIPAFYYFLLTPTVGPIIATLVFAAIWPFNERSTVPSSEKASQGLSLHETAAALGFVAVPAIALILAKLATGAFTNRYALMSVVGFSILSPVAILRASSRRGMMGLCFVTFLSGWFIVSGVTQIKHQRFIASSWLKTYDFLQAADHAKLPIVAADLHSFMTMRYYAPRDLSTRVVYLANQQASVKYLGHDTVDRGILDLNRWFRLAVEEYVPFMAARPRFLIYARVRGVPSWLGYYWIEPVNLNWLFCELSTAPVEIELKGWSDNDLLFLVTPHAAEQSENQGTERFAGALKFSESDGTQFLRRNLCVTSGPF